MGDGLTQEQQMYLSQIELLYAQVSELEFKLETAITALTMVTNDLGQHHSGPCDESGVCNWCLERLMLDRVREQIS